MLSRAAFAVTLLISLGSLSCSKSNPVTPSDQPKQPEQAAALAAPKAEQPALTDSPLGEPRVYPDVIFPKDAAVVDVKRDFGAKGDGVADDTEALQKALDIGRDPTKVAYIPNGTYRVTKTLVVRPAIGPWLYGQSREKTVLKLDDNVKNVTSVLRTHPNDSGDTSSDWFMRNIRNLTIDVGNNPEVDGIRFYATNSGLIQNVAVRGNGKVGINSTFVGGSGPNMVQDVTIEGFETGIVSNWIYGQTLSRITIKNCRKEAVVVEANATAIEDLTVIDTPVALKVSMPNDWWHWAGVVTLIGGRFSSKTPAGPAIINEGVLYARNVKTQGYAKAIEDKTEDGQGVAEKEVHEYLSEPTMKLFDEAPSESLKLPIRAEPLFPWEQDPEKWLSANDFGAIPGDQKDDTAAIQKALDEAARLGKTTVTFRGVGGPDPNAYTMAGQVFVRGSVRHILGLGFGRLLSEGAPKGSRGGFVITDESAPVVKFQNIDAFGGDDIAIENRSKNRTMVVESTGAQVIGSGQGDIFITDFPGHVLLKSKGQRVWARHLNVEGTSDEGLVFNHGADLWVLGTKSEGRGIRFVTTSGGRTEIFGALEYTNVPIEDSDRRPMFVVENAQFSLAGIREICHSGKTYNVKVRETRGDDTRELGNDRAQGWTSFPLFSGWSKK